MQALLAAFEAAAEKAGVLHETILERSVSHQVPDRLVEYARPRDLTIVPVPDSYDQWYAEAIQPGFALLRAATAAMLAVSWPSPASALSDEDWDSCARAGEFSSDRPIRGCTAVIKAGERIITQLVAAYNNRGLAFRSNGELDWGHRRL